jgi:hypothetical protein
MSHVTAAAYFCKLQSLPLTVELVNTVTQHLRAIYEFCTTSELGVTINERRTAKQIRCAIENRLYAFAVAYGAHLRLHKLRSQLLQRSRYVVAFDVDLAWRDHMTAVDQYFIKTVVPRLVNWFQQAVRVRVQELAEHCVGRNRNALELERIATALVTRATGMKLAALPSRPNTIGCKLASEGTATDSNAFYAMTRRSLLQRNEDMCEPEFCCMQLWTVPLAQWTLQTSTPAAASAAAAASTSETMKRVLATSITAIMSELSNGDNDEATSNDAYSTCSASDTMADQADDGEMSHSSPKPSRRSSPRC